MGRDYGVKWIQGGRTFNLVSPYDAEKFDPGTLNMRIPSSETLSDGEYQDDSYAEARSVVVSGHLDADDPDTLRARWDVLAGAFRRGSAGQLYRSSDRYLNARVQAISEQPDEGLNYVEWSIGFRCADPFYYESTSQSTTIAADGSPHSITAGGNVEALPVFTFVVSHVGTITVVTNAGTGFTLTPTATGTYVVDCAAGTVIKNNTDDGIAIFGGAVPEFISLPPEASTLTITLIASAALSSAPSVSWVRRWQDA